MDPNRYDEFELRQMMEAVEKLENGERDEFGLRLLKDFLIHSIGPAKGPVETKILCKAEELKQRYLDKNLCGNSPR